MSDRLTAHHENRDECASPVAVSSPRIAEPAEERPRKETAEYVSPAAPGGEGTEIDLS